MVTETTVHGFTEEGLPDHSAPPRRREILTVFAVLAIASVILWWRFLPLPHQDLDFYSEPAYLLAHYGKLANPAAQHYDLTFQKGSYNYPPGYYLILAAWIKAFRFSPDSLLGYTHTVHIAFLVGLWFLLRFRYGCSKIVSALVVFSVFPFFHHGRPDLTGALFGVLAWIALPDGNRPGRLIVSGCLTGCTALISPAFGVGTSFTLAALILLDQSTPLRVRLRSLSFWLLFAGASFAVVVAVVLSIQRAWLLAYVEFTTNVAIRGRELNVWPHPFSEFGLAFWMVPFVLIAFLPACFVVVRLWRNRRGDLRNVALAFLAGTAMWLASNKSQFLTDYHFMFPAKGVFLGVFSSWPKVPRTLRIGPLVLLAMIGWYYQKADFLYLAAPLRSNARQYVNAVRPLAGADEIAVDSLYFAQLYKPWHTLDYETLDQVYWRRYLNAIPIQFRAQLLQGLAPEPPEPIFLMASSMTLMRFGPKGLPGFRCSRPPNFANLFRFMGHTWNLPANPYAAMICTRAVGASPLAGRR